MKEVLVVLDEARTAIGRVCGHIGPCVWPPWATRCVGVQMDVSSVIWRKGIALQQLMLNRRSYPVGGAMWGRHPMFRGRNRSVSLATLTCLGQVRVLWDTNKLLWEGS